MLTSNSTPCEEQLRSEINRLTEERRSYASQLNHTLPIFRLAPDTLCLIFQFYKQDALDEHIKTSTHYLYSWNSSVPRLSGRPWCYVPWVAVSHVCRRFRGIALEFASFWDTLCATSVPWTRELIRRSKQAPLHVCYLRTLSPIGDTINQGREIYLVCLRLALAHSARIETLELDDFSLESISGRDEVFEEVLNPKRFLNLRNIKITLSRIHGNPILLQPGNLHSAPSAVPDGSDALSRLLQSVIQNPLSPLRNLHLSGFGRKIWSPASSSSSLVSLSRLVIVACQDATLSAILSTLKNLPQLQHLIIRDCHQIDSFTLGNLPPDDHLMGVTLSFLRSFTLSGVLGVGGRLFESLILPIDVKLRLEVGSSTSPYLTGMGGVGETSFPERFEGLLHVLDPYLQYHSTHESPPVSFIDQEVSKSRGRSMLFTNGPGAFCFALSDTDDYDPPVGAFGSPPWSIPPISSHRSPTPNASFQFVADLGRRPEAAALISEALLSRVISGSILESVERVTLREFQPGRTEVCSWSTARWLQTVVHLPQLRVVDADLNYPCMALLSGLLDIRDERDELRQQTQLSSIPLPAPQLETLQLCRADWRLIANVPPLAGTTDHIAYGPFGGIGAYPMGPVSILPPLPPQPFASRRLAATAAQTIISNIGNPGTGVSSSANPLFSPASFASPPHLNPSEPASHPIVLDTVTLFGQEMPSMEVLRDLLVHPRPFATVLQTRKGASLPLKKLNIRKSQMSEEAFEKLQEVVSEVDWDDKTAYNWKRDLWESTIESTDDNLDALNNLVRKT